MPRYIDVKRLCDWLKNLKSGFTKEELVFRDELIEHLQGNNGIVNVLPTADVVEVVRCKDCGSYNKHYGECTLNGSHFGENGYCCQGKRTPKKEAVRRDD